MFILFLGSGKTYTMVGTPDNPGCMVRALNDLFKAMDANNDVIFKVRSKGTSLNSIIE